VRKVDFGGLLENESCKEFPGKGKVSLFGGMENESRYWFL
jgi:hypothetical protein